MGNIFSALSIVLNWIANGEQEEEDDNECPICLDPFSGEVTVLPCGHKFHAQCIDQWFAVQLTCGECLMEIIPNGFQ